MPTAYNDGIGIYYQVEGSGPPLVLHPPYRGRLEDWHHGGYVEALKEDYLLVLIDPRGQGRSDKPHDPADYSLSKRVADVVAVLDDLGLPTTHYLGYSMGARIGFGLGIFAQDRFASLILGGMNAAAGEPTPEAVLARLDRGDVRADLDDVVRRTGPFPPGFYESWAANDGRALAAFRRAVSRYPSVVDQLPGVSLPTLIYSGSRDAMHDGAREAAAVMPNASFFSLKGLDHLGAFFHVEVVLPHLKAFLRDVSSRR